MLATWLVSFPFMCPFSKEIELVAVHVCPCLRLTKYEAEADSKEGVRDPTYPWDGFED